VNDTMYRMHFVVKSIRSRVSAYSYGFIRYLFLFSRIIDSFITVFANAPLWTVRYLILVSLRDINLLINNMMQTEVNIDTGGWMRGCFHFRESALIILAHLRGNASRYRKLVFTSPLKKVLHTAHQNVKGIPAKIRQLVGKRARLNGRFRTF